MNNIQIRFINFLLFCTGLRIALAYSPYIAYSPFDKVLSLLLLIIGLGFFVIYFFGLRQTGLETGGKPIWWNFLRPVHSILFILASYFVWINKEKWASFLLFIDVTLGLLMFILWHFVYTDNYLELFV